MPIKGLTPEEAALIAAYPASRIKRCALGESSNWDDKPFRQRHAEMSFKAAVRRRVAKARQK